jgi:hypothetical protein
LQAQADVLRDIEGERCLSHGGAGGDDDQIAAVHATGHFVELGEAGADALDALAGIEEGGDAAFVVLQNLRGVDESRLGP